MVFDATVVHDVAAYLAAPFDFFLGGFDFCLFFHAVAQFALVELGAEESHGIFFVFGLVAGLGVFDEDFFFFACVGVFVLVAQTHTAFDFVDVLATGAAAAEGVPAEARHVDDYFDGVVDEGGDTDGGKGGHAFALGVEGTDADETVDSGFAFEVAESVVAFYLHGDAFDACPFSVEDVGDGYMVVVGFGIADVHAHEHFGPVLRFDSSGSCVDGEDGVEVVALALEHVFEFEGFDKGLRDGYLVEDFLLGGIAAVKEFTQDGEVATGVFYFFVGVDPGFLGLDGFHDALGLLGVVPEVGGFGLLFFFCHLGDEGVDIEVATQGFGAALEVFYGFGGGHLNVLMCF